MNKSYNFHDENVYISRKWISFYYLNEYKLLVIKGNYPIKKLVCEPGLELKLNLIDKPSILKRLRKIFNA